MYKTMILLITTLLISLTKTENPSIKLFLGKEIFNSMDSFFLDFFTSNLKNIKLDSMEGINKGIVLKTQPSEIEFNLINLPLETSFEENKICVKIPDLRITTRFNFTTKNWIFKKEGKAYLFSKNNKINFCLKIEIDKSTKKISFKPFSISNNINEFILHIESENEKEIRDLINDYYNIKILEKIKKKFSNLLNKDIGSKMSKKLTDFTDLPLLNTDFALFLNPYKINSVKEGIYIDCNSFFYNRNKGHAKHIDIELNPMRQYDNKNINLYINQFIIEDLFSQIVKQGLVQEINKSTFPESDFKFNMEEFSKFIPEVLNHFKKEDDFQIFLSLKNPKDGNKFFLLDNKILATFNFNIVFHNSGDKFLIFDSTITFNFFMSMKKNIFILPTIENLQFEKIYLNYSLYTNLCNQKCLDKLLNQIANLKHNIEKYINDLLSKKLLKLGNADFKFKSFKLEDEIEYFKFQFENMSENDQYKIMVE